MYCFLSVHPSKKLVLSGLMTRSAVLMPTNKMKLCNSDILGKSFPKGNVSYLFRRGCYFVYVISNWIFVFVMRFPFIRLMYVCALRVGRKQIKNCCLGKVLVKLEIFRYKSQWTGVYRGSFRGSFFILLIINLSCFSHFI